MVSASIVTQILRISHILRINFQLFEYAGELRDGRGASAGGEVPAPGVSRTGRPAGPARAGPGRLTRAARPDPGLSTAGLRPRQQHGPPQSQGNHYLRDQWPDTVGVSRGRGATGSAAVRPVCGACGPLRAAAHEPAPADGQVGCLAQLACSLRVRVPRAPGRAAASRAPQGDQRSFGWPCTATSSTNVSAPRKSPGLAVYSRGSPRGWRCTAAGRCWPPWGEAHRASSASGSPVSARRAGGCLMSAEDNAVAGEVGDDLEAAAEGRYVAGQGADVGGAGFGALDGGHVLGRDAHPLG